MFDPHHLVSTIFTINMQKLLSDSQADPIIKELQINFVEDGINLIMCVPGFKKEKLEAAVKFYKYSYELFKTIRPNCEIGTEESYIEINISKLEKYIDSIERQISSQHN